MPPMLTEGEGPTLYGRRMLMAEAPGINRRRVQWAQSTTMRWWWVRWVAVVKSCSRYMEGGYSGNASKERTQNIQTLPQVAAGRISRQA